MIMDSTETLVPGRTKLGFREGNKGTHSARTLMLEELTQLLAHADETMRPADYRRLVVKENVLGKPTYISRDRTSTTLRTLYGLDPTIPVFRVLLQLWSLDERSRPMLALLAGYARDPILRSLAPIVLQAELGDVVTPKSIVEEIERRFPNRFSEISARAVASRVLSTFTQSGHLSGRVVKRRQSVVSNSVSACYAFFLAYLDGFRSRRIFSSEWGRLLDASEFQLHELARDAAQRGLMNFYQAGDVCELRFPYWLSPSEEELTRE